MKKEFITLDTECLPNYFLVTFRNIKTGKCIHFEKFEDSELDLQNIKMIMKKYHVVTFNGLGYDALMLEGAFRLFTNEQLKALSDDIIQQGKPFGKPAYKVRMEWGLKLFKFDHTDIMSVCPLKASLKMYLARVHFPVLFEMPVPHNIPVTKQQTKIIKEYCETDNAGTAFLFHHLRGELKLRDELGKKYGINVRSKSDQQIAEEIYKVELKNKHGVTAKKTKFKVGHQFLYQAPYFLSLKTKAAKALLKEFQSEPITIGKSGHCQFTFSDFSESYKLNLGGKVYTMGLGGIHSTEKKVRHTNERHIIKEVDVASFYPFIIINMGLFPKHLTKAFLIVFKTIVEDRLAAKYSMQDIIAESLKIVINGTFGKTSDKYSILYAPELMATVTITGQLLQVMLIEMFNEKGIEVISANTDGIVVKYEPHLDDAFNDCVLSWELETNCKLDSNDYESLNSRDVNNYIAVKAKPIKEGVEDFDSYYQVKGKGEFADTDSHFYSLRNNPTTAICSEAVKIFLKTGQSIEETIYNCEDITKFISVRVCNPSGQKDGVVLGRILRWYYGKYELGAIHSTKSGNRVANTIGAVPVLNLPDEWPDDLDYDWYIKEAYKMLKNVGYDVDTLKVTI